MQSVNWRRLLKDDMTIAPKGPSAVTANAMLVARLVPNMAIGAHPPRFNQSPTTGGLWTIDAGLPQGKVIDILLTTTTTPSFRRSEGI